MLNVAVDRENHPPTFGQCAGVVFSAKNYRLSWAPEDFAYGLELFADSACFRCKTTIFWYLAYDCCTHCEETALSIGRVFPTSFAKGALHKRLIDAKVLS